MKSFINVTQVILALCLSLFVQSAFALGADQPYRPTDLEFKGFVKIKNNRELYVDLQKAKGNKPTIVLLNGLTYSTKQWDDFAAPFLKSGYGVIRYDMFGMGETLLKYAPITNIIRYQDQVEDLKQLLTALEIKPPYNFVGLSYGGAIAISFAATYPKLVKNAILMAPYVAPLAEQDSWIRSQIWYTRRVAPWNGASDDELYDFYLRQLVYTTYPLAEPISIENPFKLEGLFRMVQSVRKLNAASIADRFGDGVIHLVIAVRDQYIPTADHQNFWDAVPSSARGSVMYLHDSEHKIVEDVPLFSAAWVNQIVTGNTAIKGGVRFEGFPLKGEARSEATTIKLPRE